MLQYYHSQILCWNHLGGCGSDVIGCVGLQPGLCSASLPPCTSLREAPSVASSDGEECVLLVHVTVEDSFLPGLLKVFSDGDLLRLTSWSLHYHGHLWGQRAPWGWGRRPWCQLGALWWEHLALHFLSSQAALQGCGEPMAFPVSADPCNLPYQSGRNGSAECHQCPYPFLSHLSLIWFRSWLVAMAMDGGVPAWEIYLFVSINLSGGGPEEREVLVFREEAQEMEKLEGS